jgi:hypothetical protein
VQEAQQISSFEEPSISDGLDDLKKFVEEKRAVLEMVKKNGRALEHVSDIFKKDKDVVLAAMNHNVWAFQYADESLKNDRDFLLEAIYVNGWVFEQINESIRKDRDFMLKAININGAIIMFADESFKKDEAFALEAIKQNEYALKYVNQALREDENFVLKAIRKNEYALQYADKSLLEDEEFVLSAVKEHGWELLIMNKLLGKDIDELRDFLDDPDDFEVCEKMHYDLKELDISFPERLGSDIINQIIFSRKNLDKKENLPLAVIIYPKEDWNDAFRTNQIRELIRRGYRVVYFEAKNENEVYESLKSATTNVGKAADLFVLGGHGTQTHISMGAGDPGRSGIENEEFYIDTSDEKEMISLKNCLNKDSVIILDSCSTGKGKSEASNVANALRSIFPQSSVFAPTISTSVKKYKYDQNNKVIKPIYDTSSKNTYSARPKNR